MDRRGVSSQVFMWIFALIVIGLILYFGVTSLAKVIHTGEVIDVLTFQNQLKKETGLMYGYAYGSNKELIVNVPSSIKVVCFMDLTRPTVLTEYKQINKYRGLTKDVNLFYVTLKGKEPEPYKIPKLKPKQNPLCKEVKMGRISLVLDNKGDHVEVM